MPETQVSLDQIATIDDENVVSRELEGEAVILNLKSGTYFGLNEVGTRIWALIPEHKSLRKVFEALKEEYEVSPPALETYLLELVDQLQAKGLVILAPREERKSELKCKLEGPFDPIGGEGPCKRATRASLQRLRHFLAERVPFGSARAWQLEFS
jgi:hypothetical protein